MNQQTTLPNPNPGEWLEAIVINPITGLPESCRAMYRAIANGTLIVSRWQGVVMCRSLMCRTREEAIGAVRGWVER
jgi:hypothetical protein